MNKELIPITVSVILIMISLGAKLFRNVLLNEAHYFGIALLTISLLFYFVSKKVYIILFGLTLITGFFGFIKFFFVDISIGFGDFGINPLFIFLLILFFYFNRDLMNKMFPEKN